MTSAAATPAEIHVRQGSPDEGTGGRLRREFLAGAAAFLGQPLDTEAAMATDPDLMAPDGRFFVVSVDGVDVGCGGGRRVDVHGEPAVEVKRMYVRHSARGLGAGRALLQAIEDWARSLPVSVLVLDTSDRLPEAPALYRSSGFTAVPAYNENPHADLWMAKRLRPGHSS